MEGYDAAPVAKQMPAWRAHDAAVGRAFLMLTRRGIKVSVVWAEDAGRRLLDACGVARP
jgi:hypothetical protein